MSAAVVDRHGNLQASLVPSDGVPAPGDVIAGKYVVEGLLGVGGMGIVVAARHRALGTPVAIKLLIAADEQFQGEAKVRLIREARAAAALTSDAFVRVYDVDEDTRGRPFIVMERLEGADLGETLQFRGTLSVAEAAAVVVQACRAIAEAHRVGIVHRDLKPSNLFVTRRGDGSAQIKVLDFGIAKSLRPEELGQQTLTGTRTALGSPAYMSPEQVRDPRKVDARTDVWSLGLILYELLTGRVAFSASTLPGVCAAIVADAPAAPSQLRPELPLELDAVVLACLEKERERRLQSADDLRLRLAPFAAETLEFARLLPVSALPHTLALPGSPEEFAAPSVESEPAPLPRSVPPAVLGRHVVSHERTLQSAAPTEPLLAVATLAEGTTPLAPAVHRRRRIALAGLILLVLGGVAVGALFLYRAPAQVEARADAPASSSERGLAPAGADESSISPSGADEATAAADPSRGQKSSTSSSGADESTPPGKALARPPSTPSPARGVANRTTPASAASFAAPKRVRPSRSPAGVQSASTSPVDIRLSR